MDGRIKEPRVVGGSGPVHRSGGDSDRDDASLVKACLSGSLEQRAAAFAGVVERYRGVVGSVCCAAVCDRTLGEDLAQDAFLIAWRALDELRDPTRLGPWLASIARNLAANARRRARELPSEQPAVDGSAISPGDQLLAREAALQLHNALLRMPRRYREAVVLFYWDGCSSHQVAARLGITEAAAQKRLSRARGYLREEIANRLHDDAARARRRPSAALTRAVVAAIMAAGVGRDLAEAGPARPALPRRLVHRRLGWWSAGLASLGVVLGVVRFNADEPVPGHAMASSAEPAIARGHGGPVPARAGEPATDEASAPPELPGPLRVEGIVVNGDDVPVAGARVWIDSVPVREAITRADGTFWFGGLVDRTYLLSARWDDQASRRVLRRPAVRRDPVQLRLTPGTALELTVVAELTRAPIVNARVELSRLETVSAISDGSGRAVFRGLPRGRYDVTVTPPAAGGAIELVAPVSVTLPTGETERTTLTVPRGAPISGTLVRHGAPVSGEIVVAEALARPRSAGRAEVAHATTDRAGRWRISALPAGSYRLVTGNRASTAIVVTHDGISPVGQVALELGEAVPLSGRVVQATGEPAPYATIEVAVAATPGSPPPTVLSAFELSRRSGTRHELTGDGDGAFTIADVPPGLAISLRARAGDASSSEVRFEAVDRQGPVTITLDRASSIDGVVVSASGVPQPGAQVVALERAKLPGALEDRVADIADRNGHFHLGGLRFGSYLLWSARWDAPERTLLSGSALHVDAGAAPVRLVVPETGAVAGRVRYEDGTIPQRFEVLVSTREPGFGTGVAFASPDGRFVISGLAAGTQRLAIQGEASHTERFDVAVSADGTTELGGFTLRRGATVRGRVIANGIGVSGATVVLGYGIKGGDRRLDPSGGFRATTDADGSFAFTGLAPQRACVIAEHVELGRSIPVCLAVGSAAVPPLELTLQTTGAVAGHVLPGGSHRERWVTLVPVEARRNAGWGEVAFEASPADDGGYRIAGLAPGLYTVGISGREAGTIDIASGVTAARDLEAPRDALIDVHVQWSRSTGSLAVALLRGARSPATSGALAALARRGGGEPIEVLFVDGTAVSSSTKSDRARFRDVPSGEYTACAYAAAPDPDSPCRCQSFEVRSDAPMGIQLEVPPR